jgi:hypothetical protein
VQFVETRVRLSVVQLDGHFSRVKCREQGPIHQMFLAVVLPDGTVVEPRVAERMSSHSIGHWNLQRTSLP